jgi:hypothetical protein
MSAGYLPVHDAAVHGPAYAVKEPGRDTQPIAAVRPAGTRPASDEPCRCPEHKYGHRPGTDAVLYSGPDAVMLLTHAAIRDGRYEDIGADFDAVQHRAHARFDASERRTARTLAPAIRAWQRWRNTEDAKMEAVA